MIKLKSLSLHKKELFHLDAGGDEPSASNGFFWPTEGFLGGVLALTPAGEATDGFRELT